LNLAADVRTQTVFRGLDGLADLRVIDGGTGELGVQASVVQQVNLAISMNLGDGQQLSEMDNS
jgi:hypothetical protein